MLDWVTRIENQLDAHTPIATLEAKTHGLRGAERRVAGRVGRRGGGSMGLDPVCHPSEVELRAGAMLCEPPDLSSALGQHTRQRR